MDACAETGLTGERPSCQLAQISRLRLIGWTASASQGSRVG